MFGSTVERRHRFAAQQIQSGQEVVRTPAILQTRYQLQQDAVDSISEARFLPVDVQRMFLALVQHQRLDVVVVDWPTGQIEVTITEGLEDAQTSTPTSSGEKKAFGGPKRHHPGVAVHSRSLAGVRAFLGQEVEALGLDLADKGGVRPRLVGRRPLGGGARPNARTSESRSHLNDVPAFTQTHVHIVHAELSVWVGLTAGFCFQLGWVGSWV